jgi:hypothetical protein
MTYRNPRGKFELGTCARSVFPLFPYCQPEKRSTKAAVIIARKAYNLSLAYLLVSILLHRNCRAQWALTGHGLRLLCASTTLSNVPRDIRKANILRPSPRPGSWLCSKTPRMPPALPTGGDGSQLERHGSTIDVTPQPPVLGCNAASRRIANPLESYYRLARR